MIKILDLRFTYPNGRKVLKGVNLNIEGGTYNFLIGSTGSGKSTLVSNINGIKKGSFKEFLIDGLSLKKKNLREIRKKIGFVMQSPERQVFESTVEREVSFGLKNRGIEIKDQVKEVLTDLNLNYEEIKDESPFSLSGGELRKVAIASILVLDPEIIILDEPSCGLDPKSTIELMEILIDLKDRGKTIIHITHNMELAYEYGDKLLFLDNGVIRYQGTPSDVFEGLREDKDRVKPPSSIKYMDILGCGYLKEDKLLDYVEKEF